MTDLRGRYFKTLGVVPDNLNNGEASLVKNALDRAYQQRTFEIEHYWKRATYFWGFQVAIFAAFGLIWRDPSTRDPWTLITLALSVLGILTALANSLSARGSTFWQQNWENHIDMLEDSVEGRLYKTVWLNDGKFGYSVSKVNQVLSDYFVAFWLIAAYYVTCKLIDLPFPPPKLTCIFEYPWSLCWIILSVLGLMAYLLLQKSDLQSSRPTEPGCHGDPFRSRSRRRKYEFVRRYAPDEGP